MNFLLCWLQKQKRDRFISCTNVSYEIIDNFWYNHLKKTGKNHWNAERFYCFNKKCYLSFFTFIIFDVCTFHWHINMFDLYFCFLKKRRRKKNTILICVPIDWQLNFFFVVAKQITIKKWKWFATKKKRHSKVYYTNSLTLQTYGFFVDNVQIVKVGHWKKMCDVDSFTDNQAMTCWSCNWIKFSHEI